MAAHPTIDVMESFDPLIAAADEVVHAFCKANRYSVRPARGRFPGRGLDKHGGAVGGWIDFSLIAYPDGTWPSRPTPDAWFELQHAAHVEIGPDRWWWEVPGGRESRVAPFRVLRDRLADWLQEAHNLITAIDFREILDDGWYTRRGTPLSLDGVLTFDSWLKGRLSLPRAPAVSPRRDGSDDQTIVRSADLRGRQR